MALMADREHGYALNHTFTKGYNTCQGSSTPDFWKINHLGLLLPHFSCWGRWTVFPPFRKCWWVFRRFAIFSSWINCVFDTNWTNEAYAIWVCPNEHQPLRTVAAWKRWSVFLVNLISRLSSSSPFLTSTMGFGKLVRRCHSRICLVSSPSRCRGRSASCVLHHCWGHSHYGSHRLLKGPFTAPSLSPSWSIFGASLSECWNFRCELNTSASKARTEPKDKKKTGLGAMKTKRVQPNCRGSSTLERGKIRTWTIRWRFYQWKR